MAVIYKYSISSDAFDILRKETYFITENVDNVLKFSEDSRNFTIGNKAYYSKINDVEWLLVQCKHLCVLFDSIKYSSKYCLIKSDPNVTDMEEIFTIPFLGTCNKYMRKVIGSHYTEEEIDEQLNQHEVSTHIKPIHQLLPPNYDINVINEIHNCIYYDINNAHLDALVEIFPKSAKELIGLRERINELKKSGDKYGALKIKYFINIYVGGLGKKTILDDKTITYAPHRGSYEWVVNRTRNKLQEIIDRVKGTIIYANTDGVIIRSPYQLLKTSDKLGECKQELGDDIVYAFVYFPSKELRQQGYTSYYCYQYLNTKGEFETKGNIANEMRKYLNLKEGQYPIYKKVLVGNHFECRDLEICKGEIRKYDN